MKDIYDAFWSKCRPGVNTYEYLEYCGNIPQAPIPTVFRPPPLYGDLVKYISKGPFDFLVEKQGDYVYSWPTVKTLDVSVRKMDRKVNYSFRQDPNHYRALTFVDNMYRDAFTTRHMTLDEVCSDLDWSKATGAAWTMAGFRKKADILRAGMVEAVMDPSVVNIKPVWKAVGKEEYRLRSDYYDQLKQRTFIVEPFELLFHRKRIFGVQNERMKNVGWSAYGVNPYSGGVQTIATRLLKHKRFFMLDGKLWDRVFALLAEVYDIKCKYIPDDPFLQWVVKNGVCSYVILPNGDIVFKTWGNNSGSGCTTVDNITGMSIILSHAFFYLGMTVKELEKVECFLFGDDVLGSHSLPDTITDEAIEKAFRYVFGLYGVELDPFLSSSDLTQFSFLGFTFRQHNGQWIPCYPLDKLAYSALHEPTYVSPNAEISKLASLMLMSAGNGEIVFNQFRQALCDVVLNVDCESAFILRKNSFASVPTYHQVIDWYLGLESINVDLVFCHVAYPLYGGVEEQKEIWPKLNELTN